MQFKNKKQENEKQQTKLSISSKAAAVTKLKPASISNSNKSHQPVLTPTVGVASERGCHSTGHGKEGRLEGLEGNARAIGTGTLGFLIKNIGNGVKPTYRRH